jgi:hypothetical protein
LSGNDAVIDALVGECGRIGEYLAPRGGLGTGGGDPVTMLARTYVFVELLPAVWYLYQVRCICVRVCGLSSRACHFSWCLFGVVRVECTIVAVVKLACVKRMLVSHSFAAACQVHAWSERGELALPAVRAALTAVDAWLGSRPSGGGGGGGGGLRRLPHFDQSALASGDNVRFNAYVEGVLSGSLFQVRRRAR